MKKKKNIKKRILIAVGIFIVVFCIAAMIVTHILMKDNFSRGSYAEYTTSYRYDHYEKEYPRRTVSFKSGNNTLQGYVYGEENTKGLVVVSHGIGGGHEGYINDIIWFVNQGWRVFAFDNTGSCESEGDGTMGLPQSALDLDAALTYIENDANLAPLPKLLYGHSWGGYAVTAVFNFKHDITASASIAGYAEPMEMMTEFAEGMMGKFTYVLYPFMWIDNKIIFGKYNALSAIDGINNTDTPILIVHGTGDETIGYDRSSIISKREKITNPNVEYMTISEEGNNGHNSIFHSQTANAYLKELNAAYDKLSEQYDGEVPDTVKQEFFNKVDREKANEVNTELLETINSFYEKALNY